MSFHTSVIDLTCTVCRSENAKILLAELSYAIIHLCAIVGGCEQNGDVFSFSCSFGDTFTKVKFEDNSIPERIEKTNIHRY